MYIHIKVTTGAKKEEFIQRDENHFLVSVHEPAEHNLANIRILKIIALHFNVPKSYVRIISGHHSPSKLLSIKNGE